jgi:hypothetical protein
MAAGLLAAVVCMVPSAVAFQLPVHCTRAAELSRVGLRLHPASSLRPLRRGRHCQWAMQVRMHAPISMQWAGAVLPRLVQAHYFMNSKSHSWLDDITLHNLST